MKVKRGESRKVKAESQPNIDHPDLRLLAQDFGLNKFRSDLEWPGVQGFRDALC